MTELGPAWIEPGGRYGMGIWRGLPFEDDGVERYITSPFGAWEDFRRRMGWGPHQGIDIGATPVGTPLLSLDRLRVTHVGRSTIYPAAGLYVRLTGSDGIDVAYAHMSEIIVNVGDTVERGQLVGYSGDTTSGSYTTAPHLHITVRRDFNNIDPASVLVRQPGGPQLDKETAQEWFVSEYFLNRMSHGGTKSQQAPEFIGYDDDGKSEKWIIRLLRPENERPV